jgi:hypothetical protein
MVEALPLPAPFVFFLIEASTVWCGSAVGAMPKKKGPKSTLGLGFLFQAQNEGVFSFLPKFFTPSHRMFGSMHGVLNIDEKNN